jgi:predicted DNA-binding transcriptional regulator YafY
MRKEERIQIMGRIIDLARNSSTGPPADLASRFNVSERSIKRVINEMRESGINIRYSRTLYSYVIYD